MLHRTSTVCALGALFVCSLGLSAMAKTGPAPSASASSVPAAPATASATAQPTAGAPAPGRPGKPAPPPAKPGKLGAPAPGKPGAAPGKPGAAPTGGETSKACPPGAFCEDAQLAPPPELQQEQDGEEPNNGSTAGGEVGVGGANAGTTVRLPPPPPGSDRNGPRYVVVQPGVNGRPGQVIVYEAGHAAPHALGDEEPLEAMQEPVRPVPPMPPPPPERLWHRSREWGMNVRVDGLLLPQPTTSGRRHNGNNDGDTTMTGAGLVGLGLSLRYRPVPVFAIDLGADFMGGVDTNGFDRRELPLSLGAMVYVNPRDVVQFYAFGGVDFTFAQVFSDRAEPFLAQGTSDEYNYFGGRLGVGLEFRVSDLIGIDLDAFGLLRTRTDDDSKGRYPEYYDPETGAGSNLTAAAGLRGGLMFWW